MVRTAPALRIAVLVFLTLGAASPRQALEWPFGKQSELPSPDGRHIVFGEPYRSGVREAPELWLRHAGRPERKRLLVLGSTARASWFPDGRSFLVVDRESSSSMASYIYSTEGEVVLDMRARLLRHDPELVPFADGHFYVEALRLSGPDSVRVAAFGHTDQSPVRCFTFTYTMKRNGAVERLSKSITPATVAFCDDRAE